jgi:hypothetical protein
MAKTYRRSANHYPRGQRRSADRGEKRGCGLRDRIDDNFARIFDDKELAGREDRGPGDGHFPRGNCFGHFISPRKIAPASNEAPSEEGEPQPRRSPTFRAEGGPTHAQPGQKEQDRGFVIAAAGVESSRAPTPAVLARVDTRQPDVRLRRGS